ncbi:hypothetical protein [Pollutimonas harenae]|uniref:Uncharacterized protein n=1 Tax=Pollutimonas harenae TaxID=657015 RepID=A0A853GTR7_9BURK|nr:hypothetical protein [Pollutimonas harenae]NYT84176.1 hypothetical protein [Pollutimonas harenae]TEA73408.1 hypothetical protein ERD84_05755 [Pollutimonas harenae]
MNGRHFVATAVAAVAFTTAHAADIEFLGTNSREFMDNPGYWAGGELPSLSDRGVISDTPVNLVTGSAPDAFSIGSLWITNTAGVTQFNSLRDHRYRQPAQLQRREC